MLMLSACACLSLRTLCPAGISSTPGISSASGDTSGAELKVLRPDTMADDAVATYLIQAYTDAEGSTKVRHPTAVAAAAACMSQSTQ